MTKYIRLLRTFYPHWGHYSGVNQFIKYIDKTKFLIDDYIVPMGSDRFPIKSEKIQYRIKNWVRKNRSLAYDLNDLVAEISCLVRCLQNQTDLIHYLDGEHSLSYLPTLLSKLKFLQKTPPIIATFHQPASKLDALLNPNAIRRLDQVIVLSPDQASYFEQYLPKHKISLIPHGIDIDYFKPVFNKTKDKAFKCLSVGSWLRDYDTVLLVAEKLRDNPAFEFHIVSPNVSPPPDLNNVFVYHDIDDSTLLSLYQKASVLFLPLLGATANNAVLEGLACGLPIVSTDLESIRIYTPGSEAFLIKDNCPVKFIDTLLHLFQNPETYSQMCQFARQRAIALSWHNFAARIEALYSELLT